MKFEIEIEVPETCAGCRWHSIVEVMEVGMSPDEHLCTLFDVEIGFNNLPVPACVKMRKQKPRNDDDSF